MKEKRLRETGKEYKKERMEEERMERGYLDSYKSKERGKQGRRITYRRELERKRKKGLRNRERKGKRNTEGGGVRFLLSKKYFHFFGKIKNLI
jgi:hypothetical protein